MIAQTVRRRALSSMRRGSNADAGLICDIVSFWRAASDDWFAKDTAFDRRFRERFIAVHEDVAARHYDNWMEKTEGALGLLILTDQFPRNAFRDTPRMYETDNLARYYAMQALDMGHINRVGPDMRLFCILPFAHSENFSDQELSVALHEKNLGEPWLSHAKAHHDIVRRFGRFPHRNAILNRSTTPDEVEFLRSGGFAG